MAEVAIRVDVVAEALFEVLQFWEAAFGFSVPEDGVVAGDLERAAGGRVQADAVQVGLERGQQLLGGPAGTQQPAAAGAVVDPNVRFGGQRRRRRRGNRTAAMPSVANVDGSGMAVMETVSMAT